jgi:hypothetical protein
MFHERRPTTKTDNNERTLSMATLTYKDGQGGFIANSASIDGDTIRFEGTTALTQPIVEMEENTIPPAPSYPLDEVIVSGSAATPNYGMLESFTYSPVVVDNGVRVSHGTLIIDGVYGTFTLDGTSKVENGTLDADGGRYRINSTTLNGSLTVGNNATADFTDGDLTGNGTITTTGHSSVISVGGGGLGDVKDVTFDLRQGGVLNIDDPMSFLGTVDMGRDTTVNINTSPYSTPASGALGAASEVWDIRTDVLTILGSAGQVVATAQFGAGTPELFATQNTATSGITVSEERRVDDMPVAVKYT